MLRSSCTWNLEIQISQSEKSTKVGYPTEKSGATPTPPSYD